jgi:hypothetical protein
MATHKRLRNMTAGSATSPGGQSYSQDCSICLNTIAVSIPRFFRHPRDVLTVPPALPMPICCPMLAHMALQVHPLSPLLSLLPNLHLPQLPRRRRSRGRSRRPRGMGTARLRRRRPRGSDRRRLITSPARPKHRHPPLGTPQIKRIRSQRPPSAAPTTIPTTP